MAVTNGTASKERRVDFFVSYTGADVAWAEWTASVLEAAGFTTLMQAWDFAPGSNFVLEMHDALRRCDRVLPLLSEPYLRSAFAAPEWAAAFVGDPQGRQRRLLPVRVGDCQPDGLLAAVVYVDLVGLDEPEARRRLLGGVMATRPTPGSAPFPGLAAAPYPGWLPSVWNVPARNLNFSGRERELDELRSALNARVGAVAVLAVAGLGGVGKTQLGIEHAWRRAAEYELVWWVPAEVPAAIAGLLTPLAGHLGLPTEDPEVVVRLVHAELAQRGRWLLVFDNAEDPATLAPYLPPGGRGQILITSRNPSWRGMGSTLDLDVWPQPEAVAFLLARTGGGDQDAARAIAAELGYLPLAIEQAGAYVDETGMALGAYRDLLASRRGAVLERGTPAFYEHTVAATFGLAYDRAQGESPTAAGVLGRAALLAPDDIPVELVASADPVADEDALAVLRRLALVRRHGDAVAVHRLVGAVVRQGMGPKETAVRATAVLTALRRAFPAPAHDHRSWSLSARLLPHVLAFADHAPETAELGALLNSAGNYLASRGQLRPATEVLQRALRVLETASVPDQSGVAVTLGNLGLVTASVGDLGAARELQERALRIKETEYGPSHPEVAVTLGNLGNVQHGLGDLAAARDSHERALQILQATGSDHPAMALTLGNLGLTLRGLGDLAAAYDCQERALAILEAAYGPDHPDVARTLEGLGLVEQDLYDLAASRQHLERALSILEGAYGSEHHEVARALGNLGNVLQSLGDLTAAQECQERALQIAEAEYGPDHPDVAVKLTNLGNIFQRLGDLDMAQERYERALHTFERAYGPDHPNVARALGNIGNLLRRRGDLGAARDRHARALQILEAALGPGHPEVAITLLNLGLVLQDAGDVSDARERIERALRIFEAAYGSDHPHARTARGSLESP